MFEYQCNGWFLRILALFWLFPTRPVSLAESIEWNTQNWFQAVAVLFGTLNRLIHFMQFVTTGLQFNIQLYARKPFTQLINENSWLWRSYTAVYSYDGTMAHSCATRDTMKIQTPDKWQVFDYRSTLSAHRSSTQHCMLVAKSSCRRAVTIDQNSIRKEGRDFRHRFRRNYRRPKWSAHFGRR